MKNTTNKKRIVGLISAGIMVIYAGVAFLCDWLWFSRFQWLINYIPLIAVFIMGVGVGISALIGAKKNKLSPIVPIVMGVVVLLVFWRELDTIWTILEAIEFYTFDYLVETGIRFLAYIAPYVLLLAYSVICVSGKSFAKKAWFVPGAINGVLWTLNYIMVIISNIFYGYGMPIKFLIFYIVFWVLYLLLSVGMCLFGYWMSLYMPEKNGGKPNSLQNNLNVRAPFGGANTPKAQNNLNGQAQYGGANAPKEQNNLNGRTQFSGANVPKVQNNPNGQAPFGGANATKVQNNPNGQTQPSVQTVNAENDKKEIADVEEELRMCKRLLEDGLISAQDYEEKKRNLLKL